MIMHWKNIVKIAVPLKATYRFNPRQDSNGIFTEEKKILKFTWNYKKKTLNSQSNTEKKNNNAKGITVPESKLYYIKIE